MTACVAWRGRCPGHGTVHACMRTAPHSGNHVCRCGSTRTEAQITKRNGAPSSQQAINEGDIRVKAPYPCGTTNWWNCKCDEHRLARNEYQRRTRAAKRNTKPMPMNSIDLRRLS